MKDNLFNLKDRVIVITGAAGLLGRQHADAIAFAGGTPVLLDLIPESVEQLAQEINTKYGCNAVGYAVDITSESQVDKNVSQIIDTFTKIDGLVNNAANNPKVEKQDGKNFSRLENFPIDTWNQDIAVGLTGAFLCAKHYGYHISNNPNGGVIVNISSDLGIMAPDQRLYAQKGLSDDKQSVKPVTYSVVKTGMIGLTKYLATYWVEKNIRCNAICPGGVVNGQPEEFLRSVSSRIPLNRLAQSDEYQGTLIWMLSDASSYLNGEVVVVDGGRTAW